MIDRFYDRSDAGKQLAERLKNYKGRAGVMVLGLPRGGVVVAYEVARALHLPLDVLIVRKIGVPWQPELAMGAIVESGGEFINQHLVAELNISREEINKVIQEEKKELSRRQVAYRGHRILPDLREKEIILVDDGLATGATMHAAVKALKETGVKKLIVAVPVAELETCRELRREVEECVCLLTPHPLYAIGEWYEEFGPTRDEEVIDLLSRSRNQLKGVA